MAGILKHYNGHFSPWFKEAQVPFPQTFGISEPIARFTVSIHGGSRLRCRSKLNWIFNVWLHFTLENSMPQGKYDNRTL